MTNYSYYLPHCSAPIIVNNSFFACFLQAVMAAAPSLHPSFTDTMFWVTAGHSMVCEESMTNKQDIIRKKPGIK
jgi:hypothetical protein